jgi:DNA-binding transcriptional MocR family regulator
MTTTVPQSGLVSDSQSCESGLVDRRISSARLAALLGDAPGRSPAYRGVADAIRLLVNDGRITPGTRLPSERDLTDRLGVSRTTVSRAYADLKDRGYLTARVGAGSVVALPHDVPAGDQLLDPTSAGPGTINLSVAAPPAVAGVSAAYAAAMEELPAHLAGCGLFPSGLPDLREAIAHRYAERGLPTEPEQIVVVSGALNGLTVLIRAFLGPRDAVLTESPSYPNAIRALRSSGARIAGADVDGTDWSSSSLTETIAQLRPTAAYLMPDFQNPTGALLDDEARARTAAALRRAGALTVVDEVVAELGLDDTPMPLPFAHHAPDALSLGSASKLFWAGLRVGWIRVPPRLLPDVISSRLATDIGAPVLEQAALLHLMRRGDEVRAARREQLREGRATMVSAVARHLPDWRFRVPGGGLSLWCELPEPRSTALCSAAARHGVGLAAGRLFAPEGGLERRVRLPYAKSPDELELAVERVARAWAEVAAEPASRRAGSAASARAPREREALVT